MLEMLEDTNLKYEKKKPMDSNCSATFQIKIANSNNCVLNTIKSINLTCFHKNSAVKKQWYYTFPNHDHTTQSCRH